MTDHVLRFRLAALFLPIALLWQSVACAGLLGLAPVRVFLDEETRTGVVELSNPSDSPISVQIDPVRWTQTADGDDRYEPTTEILAFPPIVTIPPRETQIVRIGRMAEPAMDLEKTYRVYFTELPQQSSADDPTVSLKMRLRIGVPVFEAPLQPVRPELRIVSADYIGDELKVRLQNSGNTHIRLSDLSTPELMDVDRNLPAKYILPGASREFTIPAPNGQSISTLVAVTEQLGATEYDLETGLAIVPADAELASR